MNLLQIYPRLSPAIDGIGDYALNLAHGLSSRYGITTHFLTNRMAGQPRSAIAGFPVTEMAANTPEALLSAIPSNIDSILLHYSDYPYDPKYGTPFWLADALATMKQQRRLPLVIMFHEFPHFVLLRKTLYLLPWQSTAAWRIARCANTVLTNNSATQAQLEQRLHSPVTSIPVFSGMGEPSEISLLSERVRRMVVFGTPGRRSKVYRRSLGALINTCRRLNIAEICDIGPSLNLNTSELQGVPFVEMGEQPAEVVSELMLNSFAGFAHSQDNRRLSKSGVHAAYCAHGLVPVVTQAQSAPADRLLPYTNFFVADNQSSPVPLETCQAIADQAHAWYQDHNQAKNFELFAAKLLENSTKTIIS
uniref:glycosyltransferase n=1 Tax=Trichocoleus desertorum TaxID=1481672 RepID=UPI0025B2A6EA|nr:hypothetical protein [Trichocoleus desertorum]